MINISAETRLLAVIGHPVSHSLSPRIHNRFADALNLPYVYLAFDVAGKDVKGFTDAARVMNIGGFNVTMPLKEAIVPHLDALHESAKLYGAVNTVENKGGTLIGHNTDGKGFLLSLEQKGFVFDQTAALILGAGGAAKAVALALLERGAQVRIAARRPESVSRLDGVTYYHWDDMREASMGCTLLVNATPLGMHGVQADFSDFSFLDSLSSGALVYDLIYKPRVTALLKEAEDRGHKTMNGLSHLIWQAALSFEIFAGIRPSKEVTFDILKKL